MDEAMSNPADWGAKPADEGPAAWGAEEGRPFRPRAEDFLTSMASGLTFGQAEKGAAWLRSQLGKGTYEENLQRNIAETQAARERLGPTGAFASDVAGGGLLGSAMARSGLSLLGRVGPRATVPAKAAAGAIEGALYGAGEAAGHTYSGDWKDYGRAALQGAVPGAVLGAAIPMAGAGVQKVITPHPVVDPVRADMANTLRNQYGVSAISAGQFTGDRNLRMTEDAVSKLPFSGVNPTFDRATGLHQMEQVTGAAAQMSGITPLGGGRVTQPILDTGMDRVGGTIGRIQGQTPVDIDTQALNDAVLASQDALNLGLEAGQMGGVNRFVNRLLSDQQLNPEAAGNLRTDLNKAINGARTSPGYQDVLISIKEALDNALERSLQTRNQGALIDELNTARQQYANLNVLSDALSRSGPSGVRGVLTPGALMAALKEGVGKKSFMRGRGNLNELASATAGVMEPMPESGTAWREGLTNPYKWAMGAAQGVAVNSPTMQRYLANQRLPNRVSGQTLQPLVSGAAAGAGVPGLLDQYWQGVGLPPPAR